ncbi:magnesium and cobalt transport protein CorA [Ralstonia pickettii]|uniref:Mg2 transporter protein CorA family protein n=2 Tax=Ralstonia pickettii TaxID=329 RepID=C6BKY3_RALP1|nr:magnesium and cobalt transport protein CorA [Ralstonia pickettii]MDE2202242.1 magnesium and cobalt transport protein CorA [Burkholderiaceae bacterium]MBA9883092.1 magnesium and cobalt transport protein CorA [Ralstonia pickettii]MBA9892868.1 magnesium and cobalt transport protein CorA [Ralstonia pickettii]MBA9925117.1 magnesium and cobalt transport protein CorA [Ralstonia pickettii]MBB0093620.1 magnesium and cobalt transport protein CorA [Ralstonia pickettii]
MPMVINSALYRSGKRERDLSVDAISDVLHSPGSFVWLGLHEPDNAMLARVQEEFGLHDLAIEDARNAHQRPKLEVYGDSLFIVLNTAQLERGNVIFGETHLFVGKDFLVSVRHGPSASYAPVRERCERTPQLLAKGAPFALYAVLDFVVDNYQPVLESLQEEFEAIESRIFGDSFDRASIERLYTLKRQLLRLRNAALPVEDIAGQLVRLHEDFVPKELRAYFRDIADHAHRVVGALDVIREMLTTAISVNVALVSVTQNDIVKRLAGWGAILAIPTVVFSNYGMNFKDMPELEHPAGYPIVLTCTVLACVALYRKLRKSGWI